MTASGTRPTDGGPVLSAPAGPEELDAPQERAAGVLCWRPTRDGSGPELLMVHRPRYDDWSWPKGKPERGESLAECAVREAAEETGARMVLGRPLPPVRYRLPDGRIKEVSYWTARSTGGSRRTASRSEVDAEVWLPLDEAARRLSYPGDRAALAAVADLARTGGLATNAVLVIRHATARPRDAWARADADRPLVASGRRQAMALAALLRCWQPQYLLSSPWRRCLETMDPYTAASGVRLRTKSGLSEAGFKRSPGKAAGHLRGLLQSDRGGALCTHRPVLAGVMETLRQYASPEIRDRIPDANPYLHPGEVLVAHVLRGGPRPVVVAVERHGTR